MDLKKTLLEIERSLWLDGADAYREHLDREAVMVLPDPAGVMERDATVDSIASAPRWKSVEMEDPRVLHLTDDVAVLVYDAAAVREDGPPYRARITSTYVLRGDAWRLAVHHQAPLSG